VTPWGFGCFKSFASFATLSFSIGPPRCDVIPHSSLLILKRVMTSFHSLGCLFRQGESGLGCHFRSFKPYTIHLISFHIKKLLDFWVVFLMHFVPHCPFFYFLNMQQSCMASLSCTVKTKLPRHSDMLSLKINVNTYIRNKQNINSFFVGILRPLPKRAGSGSISDQNVTDPEH
jgi:hypothetical protein